MILKALMLIFYYVLVILWSVSAAAIVSLWIKLLKLRRIKNNLKRKDDGT